MQLNFCGLKKSNQKTKSESGQRLKALDFGNVMKDYSTKSGREKRTFFAIWELLRK